MDYRLPRAKRGSCSNWPTTEVARLAGFHWVALLTQSGVTPVIPVWGWAKGGVGRNGKNTSTTAIVISKFVPADPQKGAIQRIEMDNREKNRP
jgi:hypothetical protein